MMNKDNANKMKETMTFSVFAAFVLVTAFSYLVRDSIYERAAVDELQAFRSFGTPKELKPLPFIGESAKIACGAWRLSRPIDRPGAVADGDRQNDNLDGGEFLLARLLSYAYIAKTAVSGGSAELATAESTFRNDEEFAQNSSKRFFVSGRAPSPAWCFCAFSY
ncbi:MAG: hypothetical protein GXP32_06595 [Kiritimatiellaeota bacterium]|nr:hypothetical protein [Kiritimatiellota bacterium]